MNKALPIYTLSAVILIAAVLLFIKPFDYVQGAGWLGYQSHLQTATSTTVGTTAVTLFDGQTSATCHSRVVTTNGIGIQISFGENVTGFSSTTLSNSVGHWQPASTTVAYDAGLYGCGKMTARATANTPVTISSF